MQHSKKLLVQRIDQALKSRFSSRFRCKATAHQRRTPKLIFLLPLPSLLSVFFFSQLLSCSLCFYSFFSCRSVCHSTITCLNEGLQFPDYLTKSTLQTLKYYSRSASISPSTQDHPITPIRMIPTPSFLPCPFSLFPVCATFSCMSKSSLCRVLPFLV